ANGEFPVSVPCDSLDTGKGCSDYAYRLNSPTGTKADHLLFAVSADQLVYATFPSASVTLTPGTGDSTTAFLINAKHEYPVRFNSNSTVYEGHMYIQDRSAPRISTALVKAGRNYESCLIAGPGIAGDPFQPITRSEVAVVAGGKCEINKTFDASGNLTDITLPSGSTCILARPESVLLNGLPLRNNTSRNGITFGNGTTTCYGPPTPKTPWCVCTAAPCPY
ncbi:MAG: hypothetical protein Q8L38_04865, partial [Pseudohongiella sp.]|nr:hypothetical protein [Pseudohongiella sp.]